MTVECGICKALLMPGAAGRCCVARQDAETLAHLYEALTARNRSVADLRARLAAAEAQLVAMTAALTYARANPTWRDGTEGARLVDAALAQPHGTEALRAMLLDVARAAIEQLAYIGHGRTLDEVVDAVLKGTR